MQSEAHYKLYHNLIALPCSSHSVMMIKILLIVKPQVGMHFLPETPDRRAHSDTVARRLRHGKTAVRLKFAGTMRGHASKRP